AGRLLELADTQVLAALGEPQARVHVQPPLRVGVVAHHPVEAAGVLALEHQFGAAEIGVVAVAAPVAAVAVAVELQKALEGEVEPAPGAQADRPALRSAGPA